MYLCTAYYVYSLIWILPQNFGSIGCVFVMLEFIEQPWKTFLRGSDRHINTFVFSGLGSTISQIQIENISMSPVCVKSVISNREFWGMTRNIFPKVYSLALFCLLPRSFYIFERSNETFWWGYIFFTTVSTLQLRDTNQVRENSRRRGKSSQCPF
jgi:hypothetical protein